ncbi:oligopeptide transport system substrate-binding protein [Tissierella praeacuta DSM 18095]|uniref:Oligopeptide transport system substrate-binding protein n=1 Tax=Tissierella praeacuta DSM 18095 TaxID=1123404 RepID=A0A1M4UD65_9FIRM|nr:ABC transporter substrate-binding protein [Tissierella praeacuta]SHE54596.1 oligopeptide transport system substrate-binding protein [Tissierella praeacuta DSM 18095]SUP03992.1 76 kDa cell surface lipoprotein [Tissierella praeacuta]
MKKGNFKLLSLILVLVLVVSACSGKDSKTNGNNDADNGGETKTATAIKDLVISKVQTRELETFNILYSQRAEDSENLTNLLDPLLEVDTYGELVPAIAEEWNTEDGGLTWTFKIRDGVKWVDMNGKEKAALTAEDFATGLEWILNFHKNDSSNTSMPIEMIKGAEEYYEWTKTLSAEEAKALTAEAGSKFREMVGLEIDGNKLVYKCITEKPYFDTVATYNCLYPLSQQMVDELGGADNVRSMNNENMWYSGAYTMTQYIQGNEKVFTKNPLYWDKEAQLFDTVTIKMVESLDVAYQLYQSGEIDYVQLTESQVNTISKDENHQFYNYLVPDVLSKYSYQFHFNFNKNKEDGTPDTNWNTAIANKAFRQTWYYGLNLENYYKRQNALDPYIGENNFYTMKGLVYTSDGTEYTELVRQEMGLPELNGKKMVRLDEAKTAELKKQAMEELTALGVTFPVEIDYYIAAGNQTVLDTANVLKQIFSESLGDDFVKFNIKTYVSSIRKEVVQPHLHSIAINGWGADYGDPQNYLGQETYGSDNAYYSANYSYINEITKETEANKELLTAYKEFTALVEAADAITTDLDARYKAYAKAEAYMLDNAFTIPAMYQQMVALAKYDNTSKMNAMFGIQNEKLKNIRTNSNGYTTEEAAALQEAHNKGKK